MDQVQELKARASLRKFVFDEWPDLETQYLWQSKEYRKIRVVQDTPKLQLKNFGNRTSELLDK